jgi:hypothetical protein
MTRLFYTIYPLPWLSVELPLKIAYLKVTNKLCPIQ